MSRLSERPERPRRQFHDGCFFSGCGTVAVRRSVTLLNLLVSSKRSKLPTRVCDRAAGMPFSRGVALHQRQVISGVELC